MVFNNRVPRKLFGSKSAEVAGGWTELHTDELHHLYFSSDTVRWSGKCEWEGRGVYEVWWEVRNHARYWLENHKKRDSGDGRVIRIVKIYKVDWIFLDQG